LFQIIQVFFSRNIPGEFWLDEDTFNIQQDPTIVQSLQQVQQELVSLMNKKWEAISGGQSEEAVLCMTDSLFWILEDLCLAKKILVQFNTSNEPYHLAVQKTTWDYLNNFFCQNDSHNLVADVVNINLRFL